MGPRRTRPDRPATRRGHGLIPHTADIGITAFGPDLAALLEEAASALAEVAGDVVPEASEPPADMDGDRDSRGATEEVALEAPDPVALTFAWLNELVGLGELHHGLVWRCRVEEAVSDGATCRVRARVAFIRFDGRRVRPRHAVKSATFNALTVAPSGDGWSLTAYLDL